MILNCALDYIILGDGAWLLLIRECYGDSRAGNLADLVVLGADPTTVDLMTIKDIPVEMTVVRGDTGYAA